MDMWHVYIIKCADDTLYTGITNNLDRRIGEHNEGIKGSKYTKIRRPVELVYSNNFPDRSSASIEESRIKKLSRKDKQIFIKKK